MRKVITTTEHTGRVLDRRSLALEEAVSVRLKVKPETEPARESDRVTLARIIIEMDQPRVAKSARQEKHLLKIVDYSDKHSL